MKKHLDKIIFVAACLLLILESVSNLSPVFVFRYTPLCKGELYEICEDVFQLDIRAYPASIHGCRILRMLYKPLVICFTCSEEQYEAILQSPVLSKDNSLDLLDDSVSPIKERYKQRQLSSRYNEFGIAKEDHLAHIFYTDYPGHEKETSYHCEYIFEPLQNGKIRVYLIAVHNPDAEKSDW